MTNYSYKVVPAPRGPRRIKGVRDNEARFALTLEEVFNEMAREGWEYQCAETLTSERRGWFRRSVEEQTLLIFRRGPAAEQAEDAAPDRDLPRRSPFVHRFGAEPALRHPAPTVGEPDRAARDGPEPGRPERPGSRS